MPWLGRSEKKKKIIIQQLKHKYYYIIDNKRWNTMKKYLLNQAIFAIIVIVILTSGCIKEKPKEPIQKATSIINITTQQVQQQKETFTGEMKIIGNGSATSFIETLDNKISTIGIKFSEDILQNLPEKDTEYILNLPTESKTVFNHITINWNPKGHIPPGIYDIPHFDFHFYLISMDDRDKITGKGDSALKMQKNVSAEYIPKGYISTPGGEPRMGAHWINPESPEFIGNTFTKTFIYGFYNGTMVFLEPMVSVSYLKRKQNFIEDIERPEKYPIPGRYPTKYSLQYDKQKKEYKIALEDMKTEN